MRRVSLTLLLVGTATLATQATPRQSELPLRTHFTYTATVSEVPAGTKSVAVWIPIPSDSPFQTIANLKVDAPVKHTVNTERKFGNRMVYVRTDKPLTVTVNFDVERTPVLIMKSRKPVTDEPRDLKRFLKADKLVPVDGRLRDISVEVVGPAINPRDRLLRIFNHVVSTMMYDYDKTSPKLGEGDVAFVCDYKTGNCSDLHSYLISLARAQGVPTYLEYGFPITGIPTDRPLKVEGTIGGYHCWTWAFDQEFGWIPLDASDARRWLDSGQPDKKPFLFGNLVTERSAVAISKGRDIDLSPKQRGPALNNFIYPYAEANGKPVEAKWEIKYRLL
jgi:transglutaminase-like putative cysteine protease